MWILRYVILASRNRGNANLDRRTRMTFDPLHAAAMHVCKDKAEWDQYGETQVAKLENELRQDIEAYNTVTGERRKIDTAIEVRPVLPPSTLPVPAGQAKEASREFLQVQTPPASSQGASEASLPHKQDEAGSTPAPETISIPPAEPEPVAVEENTGAVSVSSGEAAQAGSEPDAVPTPSQDEQPPAPETAPKPKPAAKKSAAKAKKS